MLVRFRAKLAPAVGRRGQAALATRHSLFLSWEAAIAGQQQVAPGAGHSSSWLERLGVLLASHVTIVVLWLGWREVILWGQPPRSRGKTSRVRTTSG